MEMTLPLVTLATYFSFTQPTFTDIYIPRLYVFCMLNSIFLILAKQLELFLDAFAAQQLSHISVALCVEIFLVIWGDFVIISDCAMHICVVFFIV